MALKKLDKKVWLASPTMHGDEKTYMLEAYDTNWMSTVGKNIDVSEELIAEYIGCKYAVGLASGTSALHVSMKLAGERLYGQPAQGKGALEGKYVFCTDMTFSATVNPVVYEGGIPVFIDSEYETWNMDPVALEKAFELYPQCRLVVVAHLYGSPAKMDEIRSVCQKHNALIVEDAAESLGATYKGIETGHLGDYSIISFNGNKIITGTSGGMFLTDDQHDAEKVRKWSTQSREAAAWYQHEELGFNYRMSNLIAGVVRGQIPYLQDHIDRKKAIYDLYKKELADLPVQLNPYLEDSVPNYWLTCLLIDSEAMAKQVRSDNDVLYTTEPGKTTPSEILDTIAFINAEGRPIWKPMHDQPYYRTNPFVTVNGNGRASTNAYIAGGVKSVDEDIFSRGLCLPSDINMTKDEQMAIIEAIKSCFA